MEEMSEKVFTISFLMKNGQRFIMPAMKSEIDECVETLAAHISAELKKPNYILNLGKSATSGVLMLVRAEEVQGILIEEA